MAKPITTFTWATDANYSAGPASGNPTKIAAPTPAQGLVPGDDLIPEYLNTLLNLLGDYVAWIFDGSSAGGLDAHIVETDSSGDTNVNNIGINNATIADTCRVENEIQADFLLQFGIPSSPVTEAEITQANDSTLGADSRSSITIAARDGRDQTPAAGTNNDGSQIIVYPGRPGTGLTTQDGGPGVIILPDSGLSVSGVSGNIVECVFCFNQSGVTLEYQMPRAMYDRTSFVGYVVARALMTDDGGATAFHSESNFVFSGAMGSAGGDNFVIDETGVAWAPNSPILTWQKPSATELRLRIAEQSGGDVSGTVHVIFQTVDYTP